MIQIDNIKLAVNADKSRVKDAEKRKKASNETLDDAWIRILNMKNSDKDAERLKAVHKAMLDGTIGREIGSESKKFSKAEAMRLYEVVRESLREEKLAELVATKPINYRMVTSVEELQAMVRQIQAEPIIAVDTETTGLDVYKDVIVGVSFTLPIADVHYYIPYDPTQDERVLPSEYIEHLRVIIEDPNIHKVLHNALYDMAMFRRHGLELLGVVWDTQTAMHLLNENEPAYALKVLAPKYVEAESDSFEELFGKNAKFAEIPLDVAMVYACKDTHLTWKLYLFQLFHLEKMPEVLEYYRTVEMPLLYAILDMQETGFEIDVDYAKSYGLSMKSEIDALEFEIKVELGDRDINLNSTQQLRPALERKTGETLTSLDAKKVLKPLRNKHEIIAKYLHYKELTKLYGTYISVLPEKIHPVTGRLHARFNPSGTVTGRFSSGGNGVNLQNQPEDARKLFVAPEGKVLIGADWSQQEVRCMAYFTDEPTLVSAYQTGLDVYSSMASEFFDKPYDECGDGSKERKIMKVIVLAVMYGMGPGALAGMLGITKEEAEKFIADLFEKMPRIKSWIEETQKFAEKHGFVYMDKKQRKRRLPEAKLKVDWKDWEKRGRKMRALRQGPNAVIQGTSSIQTKLTIVKVHQWLKDKPGWDLWCTVHDELIVQAPEDFAIEDLREFERLMVESYVFGKVPNKTDMEVSYRWGEGVKAYEWASKRDGVKYESNNAVKISNAPAPVMEHTEPIREVKPQPKPVGNQYHVTYYYLATGMEGHADTRDHGYVYASSAEEAKRSVAKTMASSEADISWVMGCLTATKTNGGY